MVKLKSRKCLSSTFQSFMCKFQTYMYNIIQSKLAHLTLPNSEREIFCLQYSIRNDTGSFFVLFSHYFPQFTSSLPLQTLYLVTASGLRQFCFSFLKWDENFLCSCHILPFLSKHHFILINVNLMREQFGSSAIYDLLWYLGCLGIDFLHIYSTFTV